jgi:hypothetical protein
MTIGVAIFLIAAGAILRFGISTVSTHGFGIHTIGVILMVVGVLGVALWLLVWSPWAARVRSRRTVYREEVPSRGRAVYRDEVPPRQAVYREEVEEVRPGEAAPPPTYPADDRY